MPIKVVPEQPFTKRRALIAVKNMTSTNLQVKNKKILTFGPQKGEWAVYKDIDLQPNQCALTEFLENETHQFLVYTKNNSNEYLYMIRDTDVSDKNSILLYDTRYEIVPELVCE